MRSVLFLVRKEYLQIFRDRATLVQILGIPVIQLVVLAFAATFEITHTRVHIVDLDRSATSRELIRDFTATGRFEPVAYGVSTEQADRNLLARKVSMVLVVPADFERELVRTRSAPVQIILNAEEGAAAGVISAYATRIITDFAADQGRATAHVERIDVRTRGWYNAEMDYKHYMVPGILVSLVTLIGTLLTAQNIAREKELGTLEQLNVTPITRGQFIAGKLIPFWIIGLVELSFGLLLAHLLFGVPMEGNVLLIFLAAAIYLLAALGVGLWISTIVETQQQAMFVCFFILVVYFLLGGIYTPIDSMPQPVQWLAELNPIKHFVIIMRAVLMRGAGLVDIATPLLALVAFATVSLGMAVRQYHKTTA
jgi:ABC-2 type transport system permease protein